MYFDLKKTEQYTSSILSTLPTLLPSLNEPTDVFIIPDFVSLLSVSNQIKSSSDPSCLSLGAQDVWTEDSGAFTGEVSPLVLSQAGTKFVEIGHAERRRLFGETDESVIKKSIASCKNNLVPLICVGELTKSDDIEKAVEECWVQISGVLQSDEIKETDEIVLAYEPVWAIGKSEPASAEHVVKVTKLLREKVKKSKGGDKRMFRILYGGSAGPGLFEKLKDGVDGLFLGRFAHDPERFAQTIEEVGGGRKSG